ncbi:carbohydrate ABC transporter permease [Lachnospiraceae bacterium LCP25S3_G4]
MKKRVYRGYHIIILLFLSACSVITMFPIMWMIFTSFKSNADIRLNPTHLLPEVWTLEGYIKAITEAPLGTWFLNSVIVTGITTIFVIFTSTLIGYIFAKYEFKYKKSLFLLLLATMMVPGQVTMIPRFLMIQKMGIFNTLGALIIPGIVSAFGIYLSRQFIADIPDSICEAAKIDGAGPLKIYWNIILPNIRPAIGSLGIFTAMGLWNDYLNPLIMLNDVEKMTLPLALSVFSNQHSKDLSTMMAAGTLMMLPMIVLFIIFQKQFIRGLALSGMK